VRLKILTPFSEIEEREIKSVADIDLLKEQGYTILERRGIAPKFNIKLFKLSPNFLANFFRDLSGFESVGIPLLQGIEELLKTTTNRNEKRILSEIKHHLPEGFHLYQILADVGFPEEAVSSVKVGETGGFLGEAFEQLASYYEQVVSFQGKMKTAFIYPAFVLLLTFIVATGISIFVVPKIREFLIVIPNLPKMTLFFLSLTNILSKVWWLFPVAIIGIFLLVKWVFQSEKATKIIATLWNTKMFSIVKERIMAQFFLELYMLLKNGVSLQEALDIVEVNNRYFANIIQRVKNSLITGFSFADALSKEGVFPSFVVQTIMKGETTGGLVDYLKRVADYFQKRLENFQKVFGEMIGQVLVVIVGVVVGVFVGVFLFSIYGVLPKISGGITGVMPK